MDYSDLIKNDACATDIQRYLVEGEMTAITIRIPKNLRDAAKEASSMRGMDFLPFFACACMIEELVKEKK